MPIYEYYCKPCDIKFESLKLVGERETSACPRCGLLAYKLMSVVNHTFSWRLTDDSHTPNPNPRAGRKQDEFEKDV